MRVRVNAPLVIHETIDHEVVIINLDSGTYYSLEGTGEQIWALLAEGSPSEAVVTALRGTYEVDPDELATAVEEFVEELLAESLVVPDHGSPSSAASTNGVDGSKRVFEPPRLERFTEMQHLIALDPIHEVDEGQGWPHT
jgi:hypothetical protein